MALKVVARHRIRDAATAVARLEKDPSPRVRSAAARARARLEIRQLADQLGGRGSRFGEQRQGCGLKTRGSATADGQRLIRAINAVLRVFCARPRVCLGSPARVHMALEPFERRVHLSECRCQVARFAFVETALVAQLNPHAVQVTQPIAHEGRLGPG